MELTQEINQLFLCCRDREYIKTNLNSLKSYFSLPQNISFLRLALTTNKNFTALKIIEKLDLNILPYIHINTFTFVSIFWLHKMGKILDAQFNSLKRKFQVLNNFDDLVEETESNFIQLQIKKNRRLNKRKCMNAIDINSLFKSCDNMVFIFNLDSLFNLENYIEPFTELRNNVFYTDLKSFEEFPNDVDRIIKQNRFKELKGRLINCSYRNFSNFYSLDLETRAKLEELMSALNKIRRCGFRYYLCSTRSLPSTLTFCYLYINMIDLTKIIEIQPEEELNLPVPGRKVFFGGKGNIGYEFLKQTTNNLTQFMKDQNLNS